MFDFDGLDELRNMAPRGFYYVIPAQAEEKCNVIVVGDVKKSVSQDWFAIFPNPATRAEFEGVLMNIVEQRLKQGRFLDWRMGKGYWRHNPYFL